MSEKKIMTEREKKLALALRQNLVKRKQQQRERITSSLVDVIDTKNDVPVICKEKN
jgi:hypothetical protein